MNTTKVKTTTPEDFIILKNYINVEGVVVKGNFPVYVSGISECCLDSNKNQRVTPIVIPQ